MKSPHKGVGRILKAFVYSASGFKQAFQSEAAFRQDLLFCLVLFVVALLLPLSIVEKLLMIAALFLVLLMELVNTAIEAIIDRISPDYHDLSKKAKDIGSLLVLISFLNVALVWGTILITRFL
ncbi:MAG: diacylglycerol kinase [Alphaproteobacteria bacterium]|nr:diacylglycerol kinase [Alphaproteobacteria bacterium]